MSLYRRNRIWWIELTTESGRLRESTGTTDKKDAQEYHERRKGEIWRQERLGEKVVTWGEAVKTWLSIKPRGLPDRYRLRAFSIPPDDSLPLTTSCISGALTSSTPGSRNRCIGLIVAIHSAAGVSPPEIKRQPNPPGRLRWLTKEEWDRLRRALAEESALLLELADFSIATGVRENNALELEWTQVDLRRRVAWFYGDQMKAGAAHGIPLNDDAMAVLRKRQGIAKRYVFPNPDTGLPYVKASNRAWYAALRRSRLKDTGVVWHTLRHTWASWFVMNGGTLQELMALGGWKSYSMVLRYAHLAPEHLAAAAARVKPISLRYNASKAASDRTKSPTKGG
jgi:integrase